MVETFKYEKQVFLFCTLHKFTKLGSLSVKITHQFSKQELMEIVFSHLILLEEGPAFFFKYQM